MYTCAVHTLGVPLYTEATVKVAIVRVATVKVSLSDCAVREGRAVEVWQGLVFGF